VSDGYATLLGELGELADALYRQGWRGIPQLHGSARVAVAVAALNYEAIMQKLRQNRYDNLTRRAYLRPHERLALIPRAVAGVTFGAHS
jgi:15-cis-phytoene synthase